MSWTDWCEDQLTQAAVGWLLTSVFIRFCEDNLLLGETGSGSLTLILVFVSVRLGCRERLLSG